MIKKILVGILALAVLAVTAIFIVKEKQPKSGHVLGEALTVNRDADSLAGSVNDYYHDMDYGLSNDPESVRKALEPFVPGITTEEAMQRFARGRNNWIAWSAGNDRMWNELASSTFGALDFVKTVSNHPSLGYDRDSRWQWLGLVNEPCFSKGTGPREDRYGLWLDVRDEQCEKDPFEDEQKYPGVKIGARGENIPVGSYYGYASGIVGFRLFPNPEFDEKAEADWDPERYYTDKSYYNNKDLIRPYRVGMSCGFCHVGPNPTNPPKNPEAPTWANLNSNPGAQYFWINRIFFWDAKSPEAQENFVYQLFNTSRPGALDTSLISSDQINNPRTMNAVYNLLDRAEIGAKWGKETLAGGGLNNKQFHDYLPSNSPLDGFYKKPDTVMTPRILKDGSDSVGVLGALNRVYLNIGLFSEEWFTHFIPLIGGSDITPIEIAVNNKNSSYWNATQNQTPDLALFFLATAKPDYLDEAPGGGGYLKPYDSEEVARGKDVFAETCARCHSSKLPEKAFAEFFPNQGCVNDNYLKCWSDYWQWTKTDEFKTDMKVIVQSDDFRESNYLSTELRIPVTALETNACSPLATNALRGDIWDNFSSESYKNLPSVGKFLVHHPITGEAYEIDLPGNGRGYTRPPSLISVWSTAPYLLNNTLGSTETDFKWKGDVAARMASFDGSIEKLLWPMKRDGDRHYATRSGKTHPGIIDLTTSKSYLRASAGYLPGFLKKLVGPGERFLPWLFGDGGIEIGPIPKGVPVNLITNIDLKSSKTELLKLIIKIKKDLKALPRDASDEQGKKVFANLVEPLLGVSKCKDFVVNRGHYFGTDFLPENEEETPLSDDEKYALIEFLKWL